MLRSGHIYGESDRLFLNTELGCSSACTYCYLPNEGFNIGLTAQSQRHRVSATDLLNALNSDDRFIKGSQGTLLSIGCYSEAWDPTNRDDTIQAICSLLEYNNPIQLATKRKIKIDDLRKITGHQNWNRQLSIFISSATISHWKTHEPLTIPPEKRFESFEACSQEGVDSCLYIKPLLQGITIQDAEQYGGLMEKHQIPAVVGDRFTETKTMLVAPISKSLFFIQDDESVLLRSELSKHGAVFSESQGALVFFKERYER